VPPPELVETPEEPDSGAQADKPWGGPTAFRVFRHRNYRLFFSGQIVALTGTWMQMVAQSWLVLKLTDSPLMLGLVAFSNSLPVVIVGLFAGAVIDLVDRRKVILAAQVVMMANAFVLAALAWTGAVRVEHVMILAALNGLAHSFEMPGRQALVADMVPREDLPSAIAMNSTIFSGARTVGPAIAGVLIGIIGVAGCFLTNAITYTAAMGSLIALEVPRRASGRLGWAMLGQVRAGVAYAWTHRPTRFLLLLVVINFGLAMQYGVLVPLFARDILHGGARGYGFLMTAQGLGSVIGALTMASRSSGPRVLRQNLVFGTFCIAAAIAVFGLSRSMPLSLVAQMFIGAGLMHQMVTTNTMIQFFVADELRGRVMSIYMLCFLGTAPLGSLEVGFVGEHFGPRIAVVICAGFAAVCGVILLTKLKMLAEAQEELERQAAAV
jgi:MFS family permease